MVPVVIRSCVAKLCQDASNRCLGFLPSQGAHLIRSMSQCPLYPRKRTWITAVVMSALCQKRTFCAAARNVLSAVERSERNVPIDNIARIAKGLSSSARGSAYTVCLSRRDIVRCDAQLDFRLRVALRENKFEIRAYTSACSVYAMVLYCH